jgi:hypothetical protein
MAKYKISEGNFDKFLSFFGVNKNHRPKNIDDIIASDPKLAKIDKDLGNINREAADTIKRSPELRRMFKAAGLEY